MTNGWSLREPRLVLYEVQINSGFFTKGEIILIPGAVLFPLLRDGYDAYDNFPHSRYEHVKRILSTGSKMGGWITLVLKSLRIFAIERRARSTRT